MRPIFSALIIIITIFTMSLASWGMDHIGEIDIHGFISQGYLDATDDQEYMAFGVGDGTFQFNEMGINFGTDVADGLRIGVQFLSFDLGHLGNDEIILDWGIADYRYEDWLGIRVGLIKIPHGLYNETRDVDFLRTPVFLSTSLYGEMFRDAFTRMKGIGIYGSLPYGFQYQALYGVVTAEPDGGLAEAFGSLLLFDPSKTEVENAQSFALQWFTPIEGLKVGGSVYNIDYFKIDGILNGLGSPVSVEFNKMITATGSIEYLLGNLTFSAEYTQNILEFKYSILPDSTDINMEGYYGALSYRFTDYFTLGLMYSEVYIDKDSKSGRSIKDKKIAKYRSDGYLKDATLSFRFDINYNWSVKLEVHNMKGTFLVVGDTLNDDDEWLFYAAKVTYSF